MKTSGSADRNKFIINRTPIHNGVLLYGSSDIKPNSRLHMIDHQDTDLISMQLFALGNDL